MSIVFSSVVDVYESVLLFIVTVPQFVVQFSIWGLLMVIS